MHKPGPRTDWVPLSRPEGVSRGFSILMGGTDEERAEAEANFRLAMAAPDLLAALEEMLLLVDDMSRFVATMHLADYARFNDAPIAARAAIAKATGVDGEDAA